MGDGFVRDDAYFNSSLERMGEMSDRAQESWDQYHNTQRAKEQEKVEQEKLAIQRQELELQQQQQAFNQQITIIGVSAGILLIAFAVVLIIIKNRRSHKT